MESLDSSQPPRVYRVVLPARVVEKIAELPPPLLKALLAQARDYLENTPVSQLGRRIVAPVPCVGFALHIEDPATGDLQRFTIWVNDTEELNTRIVVDIIQGF